MNNKYKILVIEDEANICSFVKTLLESNGYQAIIANTCSQGEMMFSSHVPDLVVLDLGLPDKDGVSFIRSVRGKSATPIIVLSARTTENDKISTLDLGANDYVTKPFSTGELLARIRAALRDNIYSSDLSARISGKFVLSDMVIDYGERSVTVSGKPVKLTQTEYNILAFLSGYVGRVMTYTSIVHEIWGDIDSGSVKKLQVNMANLRKKLGVKPGEQKYIANELGVGYRMYDNE